MSSSYFNKLKDLENFIPSGGQFGLDTSQFQNVYGTQMGNMAGSGTPKQGNWFQRTLLNPKWWAPDEENSANPSVVSGQLKKSGPAVWLDNQIKSGGVLTDKSGDATVLGEIANKDKTKIPGNEKNPEHDLWSVGGQQAINKDYLENLGETSKDLAKFQALLGEGSKLADRMSLGYMMEADAFKNQGDRSVTSNMALLNNMGLNLPSFKYDIQQFV